MFYITKILRGKPRHYLYAAFRDPITGSPKRRMVAYLGHAFTVQLKLRQVKRELQQLQDAEIEAIRHLKAELALLAKYGRKVPKTVEAIEAMSLAQRRTIFVTLQAQRASVELWPLRRRMASLLKSLETLHAAAAHPACPKSRRKL